MFTAAFNRFEVEILVAEVGGRWSGVAAVSRDVRRRHEDEEGFVALRGEEEALSTFLRERYQAMPALNAAIALGVEALRSVGNSEMGPSRSKPLLWTATYRDASSVACGRPTSKLRCRVSPR